MKAIIKKVRLRNGLKVANFSSPHPFAFTDGSILPGVDPDDCKKYSIDTTEVVIDTHNVNTIKVSYSIPEVVSQYLRYYKNLYDNDEIDVVIVPLPILTALRQEGWDDQKLIRSPFRLVRLADRVAKTCEVDRFCI